jgi:hypothetical protein
MSTTTLWAWCTYESKVSKPFKCSRSLSSTCKNGKVGWLLFDWQVRCKIHTHVSFILSITLSVSSWQVRCIHGPFLVPLITTTGADGGRMDNRPASLWTTPPLHVLSIMPPLPSAPTVYSRTSFVEDPPFLDDAGHSWSGRTPPWPSTPRPGAADHNFESGWPSARDTN